MVRGRWSGIPRPWARVARTTAALAAAAFVALGVAAPAAHADPDGLSAQIAQSLGSVDTLVGHTILSSGQVKQVVDLPDPLPAPVTTPALPNLPVVQEVEGAVEGLLNAASNVASPDASTGSTAASGSAAPAAAGAASSASVRRGALHATGSAAVLRLARSAVALLSLLIAAVGFLIMQSATERRNPRLFLAPLDRREAELEFE